jgi:hypothetical protein
LTKPGTLIIVPPHFQEEMANRTQGCRSMRQGRALFWGLLTALVVGCATDAPSRPSTWFERFRSAGGPTGPDVVQIDMALVERPLGDPALNEDLWSHADEQTVALERKAVLEDNGFRVGQMGGLAPSALQNLLTSDQSCINPRRLSMHAGNPTTVVLGPQTSLCRFRMEQDGRASVISLEQAECTLKVEPILTKDGHIRLLCTPQIRHGESNRSLWAASDHSGWVLRTDRPTETYSSLTWEVTLAPNQYVLVGARADRPETLGYQCFFRQDETTPVQRLLVMRACPVSADTAGDNGLDWPAEKTARKRATPLALQAAGWTTARGSGQ